MDYNAWGNYQLTREQAFALYTFITVVIWASSKSIKLFLFVTFLFILVYIINYVIRSLVFPSSSIYCQVISEGVNCRYYSYKLSNQVCKLKILIPSFYSPLPENNDFYKNNRDELTSIITNIYNLYASFYLYTNHGHKSLSTDQTKLYTLLKLILKGFANIPCLLKNKSNDKYISNIDVYEDINTYTKVQVKDLCKTYKSNGIPYLKPKSDFSLFGKNYIKTNFLSLFYYENKPFTEYSKFSFIDGYLIIHDDNEYESGDFSPLKEHMEWIINCLTSLQELLILYVDHCSVSVSHFVKGFFSGYYDILLASNILLKYEAIMRFKCKLEDFKTDSSELKGLFFPSFSLISNYVNDSKRIQLNDDKFKFFRALPKFNLPVQKRWLSIISLLFGNEVYFNIYSGNYFKSERTVLLFNPNASYTEHNVLYSDYLKFYQSNDFSIVSYNYAGVGESLGYATLKQSKKDGADMVRILLSRLDEGALYLSGLSIGGSVCAVSSAAVRDSRIKMAILDRTFGDAHSLAREMFGKWVDVLLYLHPIIGPSSVQSYLSLDNIYKLIEFDPHDLVIPMPYSLGANVGSVLVQAFEFYRGKPVSELWDQGNHYSNAIASSYATLLEEVGDDIEFITDGFNACGCKFDHVYRKYHHNPTLYKSALEGFVSLGAIWGSVSPIALGYGLNFGAEKWYYETVFSKYFQQDRDYMAVDRQLVLDLKLFAGVLFKCLKFYTTSDLILLDLKSIKTLDLEGRCFSPSKPNNTDIEKAFLHFVDRSDITFDGFTSFPEAYDCCLSDVGGVTAEKFAAWMRIWWRLQLYDARDEVLRIIEKYGGKPKCQNAARVLYNFFNDLLVDSNDVKYEVDDLKELDDFNFDDVADLDRKRGRLMPIRCGHTGLHSAKEEELFYTHFLAARL